MESYGEIIPGFELVKITRNVNGIDAISLELQEDGFPVFVYDHIPKSKEDFDDGYTGWVYQAMLSGTKFKFPPEIGFRIFKACVEAGWNPENELDKKLKEGSQLSIWLYERIALKIKNV
jgi:hypothetical protein